MTTRLQIQLADAPISQPIPSSTQTPAQAAKDDPLIAKGWENTAYIGAALMFFGVVAIVGIISRRIEYLIITGVLISLVIITFFLFTAH